MTDREKKFLSDFSYPLELIETFVKDIQSFSEYQNDLKTKGAIERHLAIIGEATNKFLKESTTNNLISASQIIGLRNRLIHSYDSIDDAIIWSIVTKHLKALKDEINKENRLNPATEYHWPDPSFPATSP